MVKKAIKGCYGCRRFRVKPDGRPPPGNLPVDRTEGNRPFQVVGVDLAGPIRYRVTKKTEGKAYITLYACSLTRAFYLELTTKQFLPTPSGARGGGGGGGGGQFERMVGLVKSALYKSIGNGCLSKSELQDVLFEVPVFRPKRDAAVAARLRVQELESDEEKH